MDTVNIYDAKTRFSQLVDKAAAGEDVIVSRNGKPLVRITRLDEPARRIKYGVLKGKIKVAKDFDAPLPANVLADFAATARVLQHNGFKGIYPRCRKARLCPGTALSDFFVNPSGGLTKAGVKVLADDFIRPRIYTERQALELARMVLRNNVQRIFNV